MEVQLLSSDSHRRFRTNTICIALTRRQYASQQKKWPLIFMAKLVAIISRTWLMTDYGNMGGTRGYWKTDFIAEGKAHERRMRWFLSNAYPTFWFYGF
jgi:hypothetical protein